MLQATYRRQTFSRHSHEGFCVGVIDDGAQRFYRTGGEHVAPLGSIILVNADDIHTGSSATEEGWSYQAMYPTPELLAFLSRDLKTGAGATPYFPNPVVHDVGLAGQLRMAFSLLRSDENRLMKETMVFSALTWLMLRHGKAASIPRRRAGRKARWRGLKPFSTISPRRTFRCWSWRSEWRSALITCCGSFSRPPVCRRTPIKFRRGCVKRAAC